MNFRDELQNIISGIGQGAEGNLIQAAANYLRESQEASGSAETVKLTKDEEAAKLIQWINANHLLIKKVDESRFLARGAEQRVYLDSDVQFVVKLNDSVFYLSWVDYFLSLQIHNLFFPVQIIS